MCHICALHEKVCPYGIGFPDSCLVTDPSRIQPFLIDGVNHSCGNPLTMGTSSGGMTPVICAACKIAICDEHLRLLLEHAGREWIR